tara:strand:- start:262 stop:456 length:195 start_codon:yes stop_codon:yes gene_type:complete
MAIMQNDEIMSRLMVLRRKKSKGQSEARKHNRKGVLLSIGSLNEWRIFYVGCNLARKKAGYAAV